MGRSDRKTKREFEPKGDKKAFISENPGGYYHLSPQFIFRRYDKKAPWSNSFNNKPVVDSVMDHLKSKEGLLWKEIMAQSGGRSSGTNSHHIKIAKFSSEAQRRAKYINLNESELFSMRFEGDVRLWGIIEPDGRCYVIWYDPNHKVCPSEKS